MCYYGHHDVTCTSYFVDNISIYTFVTFRWTSRLSRIERVTQALPDALVPSLPHAKHADEGVVGGKLVEDQKNYGRRRDEDT